MSRGPFVGGGVLGAVATVVTEWTQKSLRHFVRSGDIQYHKWRRCVPVPLEAIRPTATRPICRTFPAHFAERVRDEDWTTLDSTGPR